MKPLLAFGGGLVGAQLLNYASRNVDSIVIGKVFGAQSLGYYNRAFQLMLLPLNQINAPSTRVALPTLSRLQDQPARFGEFISFGQTVLLNIVSFVLGFSVAQATDVIAVALGPQWAPTVPLFQILAVAGFFQAAAFATYWVFLSQGLTTPYLWYTIWTRPFVIAAIVLGALWGVQGVALRLPRHHGAAVADRHPVAARALDCSADAPVPQRHEDPGGVRCGGDRVLRLCTSPGRCLAVRPDRRGARRVRRRGRPPRGVLPGLPSRHPVDRRRSPAARPLPALRRCGRTRPHGGPGMKIRRITRRLSQLSRDVVDRTGLTARLVRRTLGATIRPGGADTHVLIAPPGAGNIGDQAMVEAFLASADRLTVVVARSADDFVIPDDLADRARIVALPDLFYGQGARHRDDLRRLGALISDAKTVSIVGADIMDGVYVLRSSLRRSAVAAASAAAGVDTTVLGFSWSAAAPRPAWRALRAAGAAGARLALRDPSSAARVHEAGVRGVVETADIVFTDDRLDDVRAVEVLTGFSGPFALVNASGLIARSVDQVPEYARIVGYLRARGIHVVLVPHVLRSSADDLTACRAVFDAVGPDGVTLVDRALSPSTIRALGARASLTVTGRMHLAIMSLSQGTPAITLATQGKVEGLVRLFDWPELCVAPRTGMADDLVRVAKSALGPHARVRVVAGADRARSMATVNVSRVRGAQDSQEAELFERGGRDG